MLTPSGNGTVCGLYHDNRSLSGMRFSESGEATEAGWNLWLYNRGKALETGATWRLQHQVFVRFNPSG